MKLVLTAGRASLRSRRASRGAVMVVVLLGIVLLAGMLFYVVNLSHHTVSRVETQSAADAAAAAGAGRTARTLNLVAMHNVSTARMIALVAVLDALPQAIAFAHADQAAVLEAVDAQLVRGVEGIWVREGLERFRDEIASEVELLAPLDDLFNDGSYDVRNMTHYNGPRGRGDLWRAMEAMEAASLAAMNHLDEIRAIDAARGGGVNLQDADDAAAFLVPPMDSLPWRQGAFDDFERPVRHGLLPPDADDEVTNRGPYDAVFGWRLAVEGERDGYRRGSHAVTSAGRPGVPIGRGPDNDTFIETSRTPEQYRPYGPLRHLLFALEYTARPHLPHSRFSDFYWAPSNNFWINTIARQKLAYCWPQDGVGFDVLEPEWEISFPVAEQIANENPRRIRETAFVVVEIKSRYPSDHPAFLRPGTWSYVEEEQPLRPSPRIVWVPGWTNPRGWSSASNSVSRVNNYVWRDEWDYKVAFDSQIGVTPELEADGSPAPQSAYRIDDYVFVGVNLGDEVPVGNPYNFDDRNALPGPVDLDHARIGADPVSRRRYLTVLGVASRDSRALLWPDGFDGERPDPNHLALAQAGVFNNHSHDLWTQMWHAQVERIDNYEAWMDQLQSAGRNSTSVSGEDVDTARQRLQDAAPLAELISH